jgi:alpha-glucosidase
MMVGEIGDDHPLARQLEYTAGPHWLHTAYSFHLLEAHQATPALFGQALMAWQGAEGWPSWSLGNHDFARFPTRLGGPAATAAQTDALMAALFCLRGTLFLYQGDELGLPQALVPFDQLQDPYAKRAFTGDSGRDGTRTPFPWTSDKPMAGFTAAAHAWLPVDPRHAEQAVSVQGQTPGSHLDVTRRLIRLRAEHPALRSGDVDLLDAPEPLLAAVRTFEGERVLCAINLGPAPVQFRRPDLASALILDSGLKARRVEGGLDLPPYGAAFLALT